MKNIILATNKESLMMNEVYLLVVVIFLIVYLFATRDDPYIPIRKRKTEAPSKRKIINWYSWRGPMFIEDFDGLPHFKHTLSDNPMALPSDPEACCHENELKRQKYLENLQRCHRRALSYSRQPSAEETAQKSWENKYFNCSYVMRGPNARTGDLGNYKQCTNNNLDAANQLKCVGLGVIDADTCNTQHLVSHADYKTHLDRCMRSSFI